MLSANFVNHNTGEVVKSVQLTAKDGQTLYDALGTDVYDYIVETDYPSYTRLPDDEYRAKVNWSGYNDYDPNHMFNDPKLAEEFTQWQKEYKAGQHPLMDMIPYADDTVNLSHQDLFAGRIILHDGQNINIPVISLWNDDRSGRFKTDYPVNIYMLTRSTSAERNINYHQYRGHDKSTKIAYQVKNGEFYAPETDTGNLMGAGGTTSYAGIVESWANHGQIPNLCLSRRINADGTVSTTGADDENQLTADVFYPAETTEQRDAAEKVGKLAGKWTTLDPLVPLIDFDFDNETGSYQTNKDNIVKKGDVPGQPADENIMYYANRQYNVVFKDITYGDGDKAIDLNNYDCTDKNQMTMAANSKTNPHNGQTNSGYHEYKLDADDYQAKLKALHDAGYVIVSSNVNLNGQTYDVDQFNKDNLYNVDGTIKPETYVVKVLRGVKKVTPAASATRVVNYKANNKDGQTLKDPTTQQASFVGTGDYYVDTINGGTDLVHVKSVHDIYNNADTLVVDSSQQDPVKVTWSIDNTKTKHDVNDQFNFEKPTGDESPDTIVEWHHVPADDINDVAEKYTPQNGDTKKLKDVILIYKQRQLQRQSIRPLLVQFTL